MPSAEPNGGSLPPTLTQRMEHDDDDDDDGMLLSPYTQTTLLDVGVGVIVEE